MAKIASLAMIRLSSAISFQSGGHTSASGEEEPAPIRLTASVGQHRRSEDAARPAVPTAVVVVTEQKRPESVAQTDRVPTTVSGE